MIRYSPSEILEGNFNSASVFVSTLTPKNSGQSESVFIDGLIASVTYYGAIKAVDKAGNTVTKKVTIKNIDTTAPTITIKKSNSDITNQNLKLALTLGDEGLGINSVKYLVGSKTVSDFKDAGKSITLKQTKVTEETLSNTYQYTGSLTITRNNTITFLVEDKAGNQTLKKVTITNVDKESPVFTYKLSTTKPTNKSVTITVTATDALAGVKEVSYLSGSKEISDFKSGSPTEITLDTKGAGSFKVSKNGSYTVLSTDKTGNQTLQVIKVSNIDTTKPTLTLKYSVMNQKAMITYTAKDTDSNIASIKYLKGNVTDTASEKWTSSGKEVTGGKFTVTSSGNYSVLTKDAAGNATIKVIYVELEFKAVWISYLEFMSYGKSGYSEAKFQDFVDTMFDKVVDMNMNAVVVQVRPFGDAMYPSDYFPWSKYASGTQGVNPGYDPLENMIEAAHDRGLEFHAWLNPYRVTLASTDYSKLSEDNPARVWHDDEDSSNDRNVLSFNGNLYYNPSSKEVQTLLVNGIKEIVNNYDVDGIHFDDYFYPSLGTSYASNFDATEYKTYAAECKESGKTALSIADWRRNNVNTLVKNVYSAIKKIDSTVQFGISPAGNYNNLSSNSGYYVDYKTWLSSSSYIDYICPQIYWTFDHSSCPFDDVLDKWLSFRTSSTVKMYVGIATYKAGLTSETGWTDPDILKDMVEYGRDTGKVDGYLFFRYDFFNNSTTKAAVDKLLEILK
jgi:uncharacterized lipoprotein YddW (UPF0748 family)